MAVMNMSNDDRRYEEVDSIEIRIGNEHAKHYFGRRVSMAHARKWAQHYLDTFTGEPSTLTTEKEPRP